MSKARLSAVVNKRHKFPTSLPTSTLALSPVVTARLLSAPGPYQSPRV